MLALKEMETARQKRIFSSTTDHKVKFAQYLTPVEIARHMAKTTAEFWKSTDHATILDAGAGLGVLSCCLAGELLNQHHKLTVNLDAYELDKTILSDLDSAYRGLFLEGRFFFNIYNKDFITGNCFDIMCNLEKQYDIVIMNPPYKKINSDSAYRKSLHDIGIETVNTYSAFIAVAIKLLADDGVLTAIVPRSFCNGLYFLPFRKFLLANTSILQIHSFETRDNAFRDEKVLQENVIITLKKTTTQNEKVIVSFSKDKKFSEYYEISMPFTRIVDHNDRQLYISLPNTNDKSKTFTLACCHSDLCFDVSTGSIVDFRMKDKLVFDNHTRGIPLLYAVHTRNQKITWPVTSKKPNSILLDEDEITKNAFRKGYYILVKRFSAKEEKRRICATLITPDSLTADFFAVENHLNIIHYKHGSLKKDFAVGLTAFLNTEYCDTQFRAFSGHTQVNATDLRNMKYPSAEILVKFGKMTLKKNLDEYDDVLQELLNV
ncbi:MAG: Eco57I restriction-modification methylase domain-containing protein [Termitinemataceae bacterium]|nr:MAG: Eco57I restriction-modification methylase domain-containing protein [Termitinemataceae bacterium]